MRIEKSQNVEPSVKITPGGQAPKSGQQPVTAERAEPGKRLGDVAEIVHDLQDGTRLDQISRQALLLAVKKRLAEGDYSGRTSSEATAAAILKFFDIIVPRSS